jgi:serine protease Do
MTSRTRTFATIFTLAIAATLVGALVTTHAEAPSRPFGTGDGIATGQAVPVALQTSEAPASVGLNTFRDIAREVNDGVVNINTSKLVQRPRMPLFHDFFGQDPRRSPEDSDDRVRQTSLGSGFVVDADGFILTNRHVVEGADTINVTFPDGTDYEAELVGQDARTDVALLKIEPGEPLTVLPLGDSDAAQPGEWVMAIGNPFQFGNSVSVGVVSYIGRDLSLQYGTSIDMIQTDAAINPGNSGGPLLNTRGEVIGINTMIVTDGASRVNAGVGFSVPINVAKDILPQLRERGKVIRGWMGVRIGAMTEDLAATYDLDEVTGAVVYQVDRGSPAETAGIEPEDVILAADDRKIEDNGDLSRYIASKAPGTEVELEVLRNGERRKVTITLGTFPDEPQAAGIQEATDRPRLGMSVRDLTPDLAHRLGLPEDTRGVLITEVETGEPAEEAGLRPNFVIVSVNGETVESVDEFERAVTGFESGERIRLRVLTARGYSVVVLRLK